MKGFEVLIKLGKGIEDKSIRKLFVVFISNLAINF